jgi:hypothetical protein
MNEEESDWLCNELRELLRRGPGNHDLNALREARGILGTLRSAGLGDDVRGKSLEIEDSFERWFSAQKWRGQDEGQSVRRHLLALIETLGMCIQR